MNKPKDIYIKAFDEISLYCGHANCDNYLNPKVFEELEVIKELVDQTKTPTLEEVKKEWEEKGWKIDEDGFFKSITFIKGDRGIEFNTEEKSYFTFQPNADHNSFNIDIEFHALIHKTLKALEAEDKN